MALPLKTLGGSSFHRMGEAAHEASLAIEKAIEKVADVEPHPRDYVGRDADYQEALAGHKLNLRDLRMLAAHYLAFSTHCYEQNLNGAAWAPAT